MFITGTRRIASALVYNHESNHVLVFMTVVTNGADGAVYILQAFEFAITKNKILEVTSGFLNIDPEHGPFNKTILAAGGIDYQNDKIWFLDVQNSRFVSFNLHNINDYDFIYLPNGVTFEQYSQNAAYNFGAQLAYAISDTNTDHFGLYEVDLTTERLRRSKEYHRNTGNVASALLNAHDGNLYLGFYPPENMNATRMGVIDLSNLQLEILKL